MRTNVELDDTLVAEALRVTGLGTKKAVIEEALRRLVAVARQSDAIRTMSGLGWEGDLDAIRGARPR